MLKIDNKKIKLVVCDIDGTTAYKTPSVNRFVSAEVIETIRELREQQIYFVFNTGNSYITVNKIAEQFEASESKYTKYLIGANGNCIYDFSIKKPYIKKLLPKELIIEIQKELEQFGIEIMVMNENANKIFVTNESQKERFEEYLADENGESIIVTKNQGQYPDSAQVSIRLLNPEFKGETEFVLQKYSKDIDISWWSENGLDLNVKDVNKFTGLQDIIQLINYSEGETITTENVIYFGDQNNDLCIFKNHKYSIAMGNAIEEVKDLAFDITSSVEDNGVPKYIQKITVK